MRRLALLAVLAVTAVAQPAELRGTIADASGYSLWAEIHLVRRDPYLNLRGKASRDGAFRIEGIEPGTYLFRAWQQGFRANPAREITLRAGESLDLGEVVLEAADCDAPGVNCDSIGPPEASPFAAGKATLRLGESCDLDSAPSSRQRGKGDVELRREGTTLVAVPLKGAALTDAPGCRGLYSVTPVRLDGLGPGYAICVRTSDRHHARVYLMGEIAPDAAEVPIYFVTRQ